jgi:hypothetical protein
VGLFRRRRRAGAQAGRGERKAEADQIRQHLEDFARSRRGVEAYVEPPTTVTPPTLMLIAGDGEWTRRRITDPTLVSGLAQRLALPVYDVQLTGYPQRMREWNERAKRDGGERGGRAGT